MPVDGPSAGLAMTLVLYSAFKAVPFPADVGVTGEISLDGTLRPVGGVPAKLEAAMRAGLKRIIIPAGNDHLVQEAEGTEILAVSSWMEALALVFPGQAKTA